MRRGSAIGLLMVTGLLAAGGYELHQFKTVHPTAVELQQLPGAHATFPGSTVVERRALDGDRNLMATNPALLTVVACTDAAPSRVRAWFDAELSGEGWTHGPPNDPPAVNGVVQTNDSWTRGERRLELMTHDRVAPPGSPQSGCPRGYETHLQ